MQDEKEIFIFFGNILLWNYRVKKKLENIKKLDENDIGTLKYCEPLKKHFLKRLYNIMELNDDAKDFIIATVYQNGSFVGYLKI